MTKLSNKSRYRSFFSIAIPATLESLFVVLASALDTQMVSVLGTEAISAVAVTTQPKTFCFTIINALAICLTILVSQAFGKKDKKQANACLSTVLRIAIIVSLIMSVVLVIFAYPIMTVCNSQPDTMDMSVTYFRIIMGGMLFQVVLIVLNASLRGIGNARVTFISNVVSGVVDITFNYLLIEGHCGFPALGVAGAAIATVIGTVFACMTSILYLLRKDSFVNLKYWMKHHLRASSHIMKKIKSYTLNNFSENLLSRVGFLLSSIIAARLGSYENSIYSVGMLLMNVSFAFGNGIQASTLTLVGNMQGSGEKEQIPKYVGTGLKIGFIVSIVLAIAYIIFAAPFYSLFSNSEDFIAKGTIVCYFIAAITPFLILKTIFISSMRSLGNMKGPLYIAVTCVTFLNPGVAFVLTICLHFGLIGIWIASFVSQFVWFILGAIGYRKTWKNYLKKD